MSPARARPRPPGELRSADGSIPKASKSAISKETGIIVGLSQQGNLERKSGQPSAGKRDRLPVIRRDRSGPRLISTRLKPGPLPRPPRRTG